MPSSGRSPGMNHDVLPFLWSSSDRDVRAWKVNSVGLERKGFSKERVAALQKAYRVLHKHRHDRPPSSRASTRSPRRRRT